MRVRSAAYLAQRLEVSERTVYRDTADLQRQGVPIEGEAGVGYRLGHWWPLCAWRRQTDRQAYLRPTSFSRLQQ